MFRTKEQEYFNDRCCKHIADPDGPLLLEGATGIGKTRAYLDAAFDNDKRVAVCLVTNQLIDQLHKSADLEIVRQKYPARSFAVFKSRNYFDSKDIYQRQRDIAMRSDIMFCTASSVIYDQRLRGEYNGVTERDFIIFDEADQIPQLAALASDLTISRYCLGTKKGDTFDSAVAAIDKILAEKQFDPETRAKAKLIREAIDADKASPKVYRKVGFNQDWDLELKHTLPGRLLKKIANRKSTIFISATLSVGNRRNFKEFKGAMGIGEDSIRSGSIHPKCHGNLDFVFANARHPTDEYDEWMLGVIDDVTNPKNGRTLVATPSHKLAAEIGERVDGAVVRVKGESVADAIFRLPQDTNESQILIAAGAWAGIDTPDGWNTIIVPKVPFGNPKKLYAKCGQVDDYDDDENDLDESDVIWQNHYLDSRNTAIRRMVQVMGRGIRRPDAKCVIVICDSRVEQLGEFVPPRFHGSWDREQQPTDTVFLEGGRERERELRIERSRRLRPMALDHFQWRCQECGIGGKDKGHLLEVHHKHPLADRRERSYTSIDDVVLLCRNCHAEAHHQIRIRQSQIPRPTTID